MRKIVFLDYLRCIAIIAVVIIHTTPISGMNFNSFEWKYNLPFNALSRCGVPLFFMISGALFINNDKKIDYVYLKRKIYRIILLFFMFSFFYDSLWYLSKYSLSFNMKVIIEVFLPNFITGKYHLWYLAALITLYILTPLFRIISKDSKMVKYYLLVVFIVCSLLPFICHFLMLRGNFFFIETFSKNMAFDMPAYSLYFVLGYYLTCLPKQNLYKRAKLIRTAAIIVAFFMISGDYIMSLFLEKPSVYCSNYLSPLTVLYSSLVFIIVRIYIKENKSNKIIKLVANYGLGIYLIHVLYIDFLTNLGCLPVTAFPFITIPFVAGLVILLSIFSTFIMKRIPYLKRII